MAKEFKTIDELISLLESRNVETDNFTKTQLMRESYYAMVLYICITTLITFIKRRSNDHSDHGDH